MTSPSDRPRAPLRDVAIYNPDLLRKEELIAYFIARGPLLERILEDLRRGGSAQHHLLIGTRGMGKTTLLKRIRFAVEDDAALSGDWLPLTFPEEQYNVAHLSDLYMNCIDAFSDALEERGQRQKARELDAKVAALSDKNEDERSRGALAILLGAADALQKRLVLLLDNIDILLDRLKGQAWALRELLSRESRLVIVGASASHPEMTYTYEAPFYDFFKVHELRGLPEDEARRLILHLSDLRGTAHVRRAVEAEPARLRTLHTLSGGNPRTLVLLYFVLMQSTDGDARTDLDRLLDHITPLYKARIEALPAQAQKVLDAVAVHWHPVTAAETAARTQLEVGVVSSQFTRLVRDGLLERVPTPEGTKSAYQVAERLLNIWYLMRQSRRVRQRLIWLVEFLRMFYGSQELASHARVHLGRNAPDEEGGRIRHAEYRLALAEAVDDRPLKYALESSAVRAILEDPRLRERISNIVDLDGADASLQPVVDKHRAAVELREKVLGAKVTMEGWNAAEFAELLGGTRSLSRYEKQRIANNLEKPRAAQIAELERLLNEEILAWLRVYRTPSIVRDLRQAFQEGYMDRIEDIDGAHAAALVFHAPHLPAVAIIAELERQFDELLLSTVLEMSRSTGGFAFGWYRLGKLLARLGRPVEAEEAYRKAIALDASYAYPWHDLGNLLQRHLMRYGEAEEAYRKAIALDAGLAYPWNGLGNLLQDHLKRYGEAEEAYRKAIALDASYAYPWNGLGNLLKNHLKRYAEAEEAYRKAIAIDASLAYPWNGLGNLLLGHLGRYAEAENAYRRATEIDPTIGDFWNSFAWCRYLADKIDAETEQAVRTAAKLMPDNLDVSHTLACILVRRGKWDEPAELIAGIIERGSPEYFERTWADIVRFFGECVRAGRTAAAIELLDKTGFGERWLPLRAALAATIEGRESLLRIAPELRAPADKIYDELEALSGAAAPPAEAPRSNRKPRRK